MEKWVKQLFIVLGIFAVTAVIILTTRIYFNANATRGTFASYQITDTGDYLIPGSGWTEETIQPEAIGSEDDPFHNLSVIARFVTVPYQFVTNGSLVGVLAFHANGVEKVSFSANGGNWVDVYNPEIKIDSTGHGLAAYWISLDLDSVPDGEEIEIRSIAYPNISGVPRLLSDNTPATEAVSSLYLISGESPSKELWVANNGRSNANGTEGDPFDTIFNALKYEKTFGEIGGTTIYLKEGNYTFPSEGSFESDKAGPFYNGYVTITKDPGALIENVIVSGGRPRSNGAYKFYKVRINGANTLVYPSAGNVTVWMDNIIIMNKDRANATSTLTQNVQSYITNSRFYNITNGPDRFIRNTTIIGVHEDALRTPKTVIDVDVKDMEHFSGEPHPDVIQGYGAQSNNVIIYGLNAVENINSQGWSFTDADGLVFVNCVLNADTGNLNIEHPWNNILFLHTTSNEAILVRNLNVSNIVLRDSIINRITVSEGVTQEQLNNMTIYSEDNHYISLDSLLSLGEGDTKGNLTVYDLFENPDINNFHSKSGSLFNRADKVYWPYDLDNNIRVEPATLGAWELLSCNNGLQNGDEFGVDCGGSCLTACPGALTPIARWDVVPYQRINSGETINLGVVAFSKNGIQEVQFNITGQGYSGELKTASEMTLNPQSGVYEYWTTLNASEFTTDGQISVEAIVYGGDGGIRNKATDGGGLGLDELNLNVNPLGTLPKAEAWVSQGATEGAVGNRATPFGAINEALSAIVAQTGGSAEGSTIYLEEGNYTIAGSSGSDISYTTNGWLTITRAEGARREYTILVEGNGLPFVNNLTKIEGLTIKNPTTIAGTCVIYRPNFIGNGLIWAEGNEMSGNRTDYQSNCFFKNTVNYMTNDYIHDTGIATPGAVLTRNLTIEKLNDDAFQNIPLVINSRVDDLVGDYNRVFAGHADVIGDGGGGGKNVIFYNLRGTNLNYQGILDNIGSCDNPWKDMAFVNVYLQIGSNVSFGGGGSGFYFNVDNLLMWHMTLISNSSVPYSHTLLIHDDNCTTNMTNVSIIGSVFDNVNVDNYQAPVIIDMNSFQQDHFSTGDTYGGNYSTGDPGLDDNGRPNPDSVLLNRINPLVVPVDADGNPRNSYGDVGAYEYVNISCTESWSCSEWSTCASNSQSRTCTDTNYCGTTLTKPEETQSCSSNTRRNTGGGPSGGPRVIVNNTNNTVRNNTVRNNTNVNVNEIAKINNGSVDQQEENNTNGDEETGNVGLDNNVKLTLIIIGIAFVLGIVWAAVYKLFFRKKQIIKTK